MHDMRERDTTFTLRMPRALRDALDRAGEAERRSASDVAIFAIEDALTRAGYLNAPKARTRRQRGK